MHYEVQTIKAPYCTVQGSNKINELCWYNLYFTCRDNNEKKGEISEPNSGLYRPPTRTSQLHEQEVVNRKSINGDMADACSFRLTKHFSLLCSSMFVCMYVCIYSVYYVVATRKHIAVHQ